MLIYGTGFWSRCHGLEGLTKMTSNQWRQSVYDIMDAACRFS